MDVIGDGIEEVEEGDATGAMRGAGEAVGDARGVTVGVGGDTLGFGDRNSSRLSVQSIRGLWRRNQRSPITTETSGSRGVTRKVIGIALSHENKTGTVTEYIMSAGA